jgi:CubicO group peptidase (beta-lactamase class C family)
MASVHFPVVALAAQQAARCLVSGASLLLVLAGTASPQSTAPDPRFEPVERQLRLAVTTGTIGSAVGLIARDDSILIRTAVGEIEPGVPMPPNAITRLASITKPVTATAVLLLAEQGKLRLSDRVDTWFPGFGSVVQQGGRTVPASRPVTVRDLLTNQAGLATEGAAYDSLFGVATADEYARRIGALPLRFQPGTQFEYGCCGSAYEVLGAIVERVTGEPYRDFLQSRVLRPLKMNDTYFNVPPEKRDRLAAQYRRDATGTLVPFRRRGQEENETTFFSGAGGLRSTVDDYHRFARFLLNGGELEGVRLLSAESVRAMTTNQVGQGYPTAGYGWGYGVRVRTSREPDGSDAIGSFGWNGGTGTLFLVDPTNRLIFVVMMPSNPGTPGVTAARNAFVAAGYAVVSAGR